MTDSDEQARKIAALEQAVAELRERVAKLEQGVTTQPITRPSTGAADSYGR